MKYTCMIDIDCGQESGSEDEDQLVEYQCGKENVRDNSRENASSDIVVIADPLPEQSATLGRDVIEIE